MGKYHFSYAHTEKYNIQGCYLQSLFLKKISFTFPLFLVFNQAIVSKFFFFVKGENTFIQTFSLTELSFLEQKMILRNMHVTCLQV